jgi:acetyl-CoA carboxylase beta subunit
MLSEVERRWEDDPFSRAMRNIVAFHVEPDMTERGLNAMAKQERVVLVAGDGRLQRHTFLRLGLEALFMGSDMDVAALEKFMASVGRDQAVASAVEEAFVLALNSAGVTFQEETQGA